MNGDIEFEIGREPASYRAFAAVDHTWGLSLFKKAPLLVDPANPSRIKPAGLFQMWLSTAEMSGLILLLFTAAWMIVSHGSGPGAVILHSPARQWKIVLAWSILGVAMAVIPLPGKGGNPVSRVGYVTPGSVFALSLWGLAWHTKTMEISANGEGMRMTSVLGYNGQMRMWELPFPGSTIASWHSTVNTIER